MKQSTTENAIKIICQEPADLFDLSWFGLDAINFFKKGDPIYIRIVRNHKSSSRFNSVKLSDVRCEINEIFHRCIIGGFITRKNNVREEGLSQLLLLNHRVNEFLGQVLYEVLKTRSIWSLSLKGPQIRPDNSLTQKRFTIFQSSDYFVQEETRRGWRYLLHVVDIRQFTEANWYYLVCFCEEENYWTRKFKSSQKARLPTQGGKILGLDEYLKLVDINQGIDIDSLISLLSPDNIITLPACFDEFIGDEYEWELNVQILSKALLKDELLMAIAKHRTIFPWDIFIIKRPEDFYFNLKDDFLNYGLLPDTVEKL